MDSFETVQTWLAISSKICQLNTWDQYLLMKQVETCFEDQADTELGEFIEEFVYLMLDRGAADDFHQDVQDLIDAAGLDDGMLQCVGKHIETLISA